MPKLTIDDSRGNEWIVTPDEYEVRGDMIYLYEMVDVDEVRRVLYPDAPEELQIIKLPSKRLYRFMKFTSVYIWDESTEAEGELVEAIDDAVQVEETAPLDVEE